MRKYCTLLVGLLLLVVGFASRVEAADNWPGTLLTGNFGTVTGTTTGATGQASENATYGGGNLNTIWYRWVAPASGAFTAATCNMTGETTTNHDTTLIMYTGTAFPLTVRSTNDDATGCASTVNPNYGSVVSFNVTAGTTYYLQVDGYGSGTGNFVLRWGFTRMTVTVTDNSATEGGGTGAFTVVLNAPPAAASPGGNNMAAQSATVTIGTSTQCTFSPSTFTFTSSNWTTPRTVTVTAIDDTLVEGNHTCSPASITAATGAYAGISVPSGSLPTINITDNDFSTISITKSWLFASPGHDQNGNMMADKDDIITYRFDVTNTGTVPIANIIINDVHGGSGPPPSPDDEVILIDVAPLLDSTDSVPSNSIWSNLAPGDTVRFVGTYQVTQTDVDNQ